MNYIETVILILKQLELNKEKKKNRKIEKNINNKE